MKNLTCNLILTFKFHLQWLKTQTMTKVLLKNGDSVTITGANGTSVSSIVENSGFPSTENNIFTIRGRAANNTPKIIANITIEAGGNRKFNTTPQLILESVSSQLGINNNDMSMKLTGSTTKGTGVNKVTTSYSYNLIYNGSKRIERSDELLYSLHAKSIPVVNITKGIKDIKITNKDIRATGSTSTIKVIGTPNTDFSIAVTRLDDNVRLTNTLGTANRVLKSLKQIGNVTETSIISRAINKDDTSVEIDTFNELTSTIYVLKAKTNNSGVFSFSQKFPKIKAHASTAINGSMAASGTTKIIFDSLAGVGIGDEVLFSDGSTMQQGVPTVVTVINPDGDNANECILSNSVTAADGVECKFIRPCRYSINLLDGDQVDPLYETYSIPGFVDGRQGWSKFQSKILTQSVRPVIILRATTENDNYTINTVEPPASGTHIFDNVFPGRVNTIATSINNRFMTTSTTTITYAIARTGAAASGGKTFSTVSGKENGPVFDPRDEDNSDFTNIDPIRNGGSLISIRNITFSNSGTAVNISFKFRVERWGLETKVIELDLDNIISI